MTTKVRVLQKDDVTLRDYTFKCPRCGSDSIDEGRHTTEMRNVNLIVENHNSRSYKDDFDFTDWLFIDETIVFKCGNCHEVIATDSPANLVTAIVKLVHKEEEFDLDKLAWKKTCESNSKCINCVLYDYCSNHTKEDEELVGDKIEEARKEADDLEARKLQNGKDLQKIWDKMCSENIVCNTCGLYNYCQNHIKKA